jgi:hypothetical protein
MYEWVERQRKLARAQLNDTAANIRFPSAESGAPVYIDSSAEGP